MEYILQIINDLNIDANKFDILFTSITGITGIIIPIIKKLYNSKNNSIIIKEFKYQFLGFIFIAFLFFPLLIFSYMQFVIVYVDNSIKANSTSATYFYFTLSLYSFLIFGMFIYMLNVILENKLLRMKKKCDKYILNKEHIEDILNLSKRERSIYIYIYIIYLIIFLFAFWLTAFKIINIKIMNNLIFTVICLWSCTIFLIGLQYMFYKHKFYIAPKIIVQMDYINSYKCYYNFIINRGYHLEYKKNFIEVFNSQHKLACSFPIKQENFIGIQRRYEIVNTEQNVNSNVDTSFSAESK